MKVAFAAPVWPPERSANGVATYIERVREGLGPLGVESRVLAATIVGDRCGPEAVDLDRVGPGRIRERIARRIHRRDFEAHWGALSVLAGLRQLRPGFRADIVEMEESFGTCDVVRRRTRTPVVTRLHGPWFLNGVALGMPEGPRFRDRVTREGAAIGAAAAVTSPSKDLLDQVRDKYGLALSDAAVIPNPAPVVEPARRWTLEGSDPNTVLFVGRFDRHKGGDLVIDAFARVASHRPDLQLLFAGPDRGLERGDGATVGLGEYVAEAVPDRSIRARIVALGQLPSKQVERLRTQARVTLVASRFEVFGMVVVEALAHGCPVVASRTGGIAEIVSDESNGLLFEPGDAEDLARRLETMLADPERSASMGARGARDMAAHFAPSIVGRRMKDFYEDVLSRSRA